MVFLTQEQYDVINREERDRTIQKLKEIEPDDIHRLIITDLCVMLVNATNEYVQENDVMLPPYALENAMKLMGDEQKRLRKRIQQFVNKNNKKG